jgi:hypothetical protein
VEASGIPSFVSLDLGGLIPQDFFGVGGSFSPPPSGGSKKLPPKLWAGAPEEDDAALHPPASAGGILGRPPPESEALEHPWSLGISASPSARGASFQGLTRGRDSR